MCPRVTRSTSINTHFFFFLRCASSTTVSLSAERLLAGQFSRKPGADRGHHAPSQRFVERDAWPKVYRKQSRPPSRPSPQAGTGAGAGTQQEQRFGKRGSGQAFALGLFQILKTEDPKVIGWSASGKAFRIGDSEKFCKEIMPRFFKRECPPHILPVFFCFFLISSCLPACVLVFGSFVYHNFLDVYTLLALRTVRG